MANVNERSRLGGCDRNATWLAEQNYAARNIFIRVPLLVRFGVFAQLAGAKVLGGIPAHVEPFVDARLKRDGQDYSENAASSCC